MTPAAAIPQPPFPATAVVAPPRYFGSVDYYALRAAFAHSHMGPGGLFDKRQKEVHRCEIADANGRVQLTVPIVHPHGVKDARWQDVALSSHGRWWHVHRVALESAYGRTPFFEFYIDSLAPYLSEEVLTLCPTITHLDRALDNIVWRLLFGEESAEGAAGFQREWVEAVPGTGRTTVRPYYQVRQLSQGFTAGLSVLDLLFNLGPEAEVYLRNRATELAPLMASPPGRRKGS